MNKSAISFESMIKTYVNFGLSKRTWNMFYEMCCHNLISLETWLRFSKKCKGWVLSDDGDAIIDSDTDMVVYRRDELGFLVKA